MDCYFTKESLAPTSILNHYFQNFQYSKNIKFLDCLSNFTQLHPDLHFIIILRIFILFFINFGQMTLLFSYFLLVQLFNLILFIIKSGVVKWWFSLKPGVAHSNPNLVDTHNCIILIRIFVWKLLVVQL